MVLVVVALWGCGSVPAEQVPDASTCTVHDTIASCGASCEVCKATNDREQATCDGTSCGVACISGLTCTNNTCARLVWDFSSNGPDGVTVVSPVGLTGAVRNHNGNLAYAIDVTSLGEIMVTVPVCLGGDVQLQTKTLIATFTFDGGPDSNLEEYYVQGSIPSPMSGAFVGTKGLRPRVAGAYAAPISMSSFANTAAQVTFQLGTYGAQFSGTIWVDDIKIE